MAATVEIDEYNGSTGTITHAITNSNYGSADAAQLVASANAIVLGQNTFQKWQRFHLTALGGSAAVQNLKYYAESAPAAGAAHYFNGSTDQTQYDTSGFKSTSYTAASTGTDLSPVTVPTAEPESGNLGIAGSLSGLLSSIGAVSDFVVSQIRTTTTAIKSETLVLTFQYDEVA